MTTYTERRLLDYNAGIWADPIAWTFTADGPDRLTVTRDGVAKSVRVENCGEFAYKLQKSRILAQGGAPGLCATLAAWANENFCLSLLNKFLHHAFDVCRPAR